MASALKYLHGLEPKIIFRDLSAANVLLTATKAGQADAKLIDFGLAKETTRERISPQTDGIACTLYPSDLAVYFTLGSSTALGDTGCTLLSMVAGSSLVWHGCIAAHCTFKATACSNTSGWGAGCDTGLQTGACNQLDAMRFTAETGNYMYMSPEVTILSQCSFILSH